MLNITESLDIPPFSLEQQDKDNYLLKILSDLTQHHMQGCSQYNRILSTLGISEPCFSSVGQIPFIPVRLFKDFELISVHKSDIVKTMTSSGTSGQKVSKIFLDKTTSMLQTKVLSKIVASFIGQKRLPMLIIDSPSILKNRKLFSARGAGILGFSIFGYDVTYALDEQMNLNFGQLQQFFDKHQNSPILLFGFTYMIWQHFYKPLKGKGIRLPINNGTLIHGGGWKKLASEEVNNDVFKQKILEVSGIKNISNYYGMVEQTGSIYMECEAGHLHTSIYSDILIRDFKDFSVLEPGKQGIIQLVSILPLSYPGHSILTEDIGEIIGKDNCSCGRKGTYFKVIGRIEKAEIRGCSDTYALT
ncbi:acyl-protein synthetase [Paenibacillus sp. GXUN7292]|uniref:LuxE/PaaK family acyltransferase n=1 Tax=Paenibacillus sp. GXUN7292 TaxID=3422499 RepID=UPI003D7F0989